MPLSPGCDFGFLLGRGGGHFSAEMVYDPQSRGHSLAAPPFWALYASQLGRIDVASVSAGDSIRFARLSPLLKAMKSKFQCCTRFDSSN